MFLLALVPDLVLELDLAIVPVWLGVVVKTVVSSL